MMPMARFEINSKQAVSEWTRSEWMVSLIPPTLLLFFIYLSKDNLALLAVWTAALFAVAFASTLSTMRTIFSWDTCQIKTYTVWGRILEIIHFDQLDSILISRNTQDVDDDVPIYSLALGRRANTSIGLTSNKSMALIQHQAGLLAVHLRLQKIDIEIKQDFDSVSKRGGDGLGSNKMGA
jgi:hypothetical protein